MARSPPRFRVSAFAPTRGQRSKVRRSTRYRRLGVRVLLFDAKNLILVAKIAVTP
jgi:hypothetical protein